MCLMLACKIRAIQRHVLAPESYNSASNGGSWWTCSLTPSSSSILGENRGSHWLHLAEFHSFCFPLTNKDPCTHRKSTSGLSPGQRYELLTSLDHGYSVYQCVCGKREAELYRYEVEFLEKVSIAASIPC